MKILEKQMLFSEVQEYLLKHKKYRLPTIEEIKADGTTNPVFHSETKVSTGDIKVVNVYTPVLGLDCKSSVLVKYKVGLVYSKEFLEFKEACINHLKQANPMGISDKLLLEMVENYL